MIDFLSMKINEIEWNEMNRQAYQGADRGRGYICMQ